MLNSKSIDIIMNTMRKSLYILSACTLLLTTACSGDYLDLTPNSSAGKETIFETTDNVALAVNGLSKMMSVQYLGSQGFNGEGTIKTYYGNYPGNDYQKSNLTSWTNVVNGTYHENSTSTYDYYPWYYFYKIIGNSNTVICNVDDCTGTDADKAFLKAQALVYRAYSYSMLVQLYSKRWMDSNNGASRGVILRIDESTDELGTSTLAECYAQIYKDLDDAISLFQSSGEDRDKDCNYLPSLQVAYAVYARTALNREDWATAAKYAPLARKGYPLMSNSEYVDGGFNTPNQEWIWSVYNSEEETLYYYSFFAYESSNASSGACRNYPPAISKELFDKIPDTDVRKAMWLDPKTDSYTKSNGAAGTDLSKRAKTEYGSKLYSTTKIFAYMQFKHQNKAQPGIGELNLFRSAEMYLIEAEADCHLNKDAEAQALLVELNKTSGRDTAYTCTKTGDDLLEEVRLYNRIELWGEGHDWFNYKRWGLPIVRHSSKNGGSFHTNYAVTINPADNNAWTWVIPNKEVDYNSLIKSAAE